MLAFYLTLVGSDEERRKVEIIYGEYRAYMSYCAAKVLADKSEVDDAVHEAMLRIIRHIDKVDVSDRRVLKAFCGRVAERAAVDMLRHRARHDNSFAADVEDMGVAPEEDDPEVRALDADAYGVILDAINELKPIYKTVCLMKFTQGFDDAEIADMLDMNPKTVSSYASRGRAAIKAAVRKAGYHE